MLLLIYFLKLINVLYFFGKLLYRVVFFSLIVISIGVIGYFFLFYFLFKYCLNICVFIDIYI